MSVRIEKIVYVDEMGERVKRCRSVDGGKRMEMMLAIQNYI